MTIQEFATLLSFQSIPGDSMITANDRLEILALYAEYNRTIDAGDSSAWACTFIEEGVFHHPAQDFAGREQLKRFIKERTSKMAAHLCIDQRHWNDAISLKGTESEATGSCLLLVAGRRRDTGKPEVVARGRYVDDLVKVASGWRFRCRTLRVD
jgi:hypothetical protein